MRSTFNVYFFAKKEKQKANGNYLIFVRITVDSVASRFNSKIDVPPTAWNATAERAIGRSAEILKANYIAGRHKSIPEHHLPRYARLG